MSLSLTTQLFSWTDSGSNTCMLSEMTLNTCSQTQSWERDDFAEPLGAVRALTVF